ncbi:hypothetical protein ACFQT0_10575 [Hymenobacter humi]|uniref:Uncharacterized protein n=1 Tax=Hymenobacter humi TaxID=1411620 RepID=A0ABW2U6U5_9BACT
MQAESERSLITAQVTPPQDTTARLLMGTYSLRDPNYAQGLFATDLRPVATPGTKPRSGSTTFCASSTFSTTSSLRARPGCGSVPSAASPAPCRPCAGATACCCTVMPQPDGGYVLVAEVYYPHYRYNSYGSIQPPYFGAMMPYGSGYANSRVFDGYQTTHALVCGFDRSGTLLWDNTFVVENLRRNTLEEGVRLQTLPDGRLVLAYLDESKLRYKLINRAESSPNDHQVPLQTGAGTADTGAEQATDTSQGELLPWFGTRFIASGFQRVRAERGPDREVFFLNSIAF